ncbi:MAG: hypothetical protein KatS3mg118_3464 [Paracoccaceae bacterium]|nr:MAG: hypothetical protein KatS3mg118_3464 [Paracoccaceae bacterium]
MGAALRLESFTDPREVRREEAPARPAGIDPAEHARALARAAAEARAAGYEAGVADALARAESEQRLVLGAIAEALADRELTAAEARAAALRAVAPVMAAVIRALAPRLAQAGLPDLVADRLTEILERAPQSCPEIRLAPAMEGPVAEALAAAGIPPRRREIRPDPGCAPLEVRIGWAEGIDRIDAAAAAQEVLAAVERHLTAQPAGPAAGRAAG